MTQQKRAVGRPEDPGLRDRVLLAAIDCYAERSWSGFNFDVVAARADVGRPALYRRWKDRTELLIDAFRRTTPPIEDEDLGSLHAELSRLATAYVALMTGSRGVAGTRLIVDARSHPDVFAQVNADITQARAVLVQSSLKRAAERGEIDPETRARDVVNLLFGSLWATIAFSHAQSGLDSQQNVERITTMVVRAIRPASKELGGVASTLAGPHRVPARSLTDRRAASGSPEAGIRARRLATRATGGRGSSCAVR